jgi:plastocyanin
MFQTTMRGIMRNKVIGSVLLYVSMAFSGYTIDFVQSASAQQMPEAQEVKIDNFSFGPVELTVPVGTTVTWTNRDDIPHTVVSAKGVFKSKVLDTDEKFSFTFTKAGSYPYFCSIHPKMTGKIIAK